VIPSRLSNLAGTRIPFLGRLRFVERTIHALPTQVAAQIPEIAATRATRLEAAQGTGACHGPLLAEKINSAAPNNQFDDFYGTASPARTGDPQIHNLVL
jgi:hypothetical protein